MGILDIDTMNTTFEELSKIKNNILLYGEGWNLATSLPDSQKAIMDNSNKLPEISFFNDRFRDVTKGKSSESEIKVKGYLTGDSSYLDGFKHVFMGSANSLAFPSLFSDYKQSINYVECHDNNTVYDKIKSSCSEENEKERLKRLKLINIATLFANGIPFFHQGQEIGQSKNGLSNTYNSGDEVNGFDYSLLKKRKELYLFFIEAINLKKKFIALAKDRFSNISRYMSFENLQYGAVKINYNLEDFDFYIIFNPSKTSFTYSFDDYVTLLFNEGGDMQKEDVYLRLAIINSLSVNVFLARKEDKK